METQCWCVRFHSDRVHVCVWKVTWPCVFCPLFFFLFVISVTSSTTASLAQSWKISGFVCLWSVNSSSTSKSAWLVSYESEVEPNNQAAVLKKKEPPHPRGRRDKNNLARSPKLHTRTKCDVSLCYFSCSLKDQNTLTSAFLFSPQFLQIIP